MRFKNLIQKLKHTSLTLVILWSSSLSSALAQSPKKPKHPNLVYVESGTFQMGNKEAKEEVFMGENLVHQVKVSSFWISKYEITNAQYAQFLNAYGSEVVKEGAFAGQKMITTHEWGIYKENRIWQAQPGYENHPVMKVTWYGAFAYCHFYGGRLPSEAEWEYAARGGNKSKEYKYAGAGFLPKVGWHHYNAKDISHQVGQLLANELGLHDMSGNVREWCQDWFDAHYYRKSPFLNPKGPLGGTSRVMRGGCWFHYENRSRITARNAFAPNQSDTFTGFRIAFSR